MSKQKTKAELQQHKADALNKIGEYINTLISSNNPNINGKADKLSYWLEDLTTFLAFEQQFSSSSLKKYKRGDIIKLHLGYNIGSEEGGLHYAIVIDKNNSIYNPVITIIPLTSIKPNRDISQLHRGEVYLGNELYKSLDSKIMSYENSIEEELSILNKTLDSIDIQKPEFKIISDELQRKSTNIKSNIEFSKKMITEFTKMKAGSIALVNQITTISKIRIYDPKTSHDVLSGLRLSNDKLDAIDTAIKEMFIK